MYLLEIQYSTLWQVYIHIYLMNIQSNQIQCLGLQAKAYLEEVVGFLTEDRKPKQTASVYLKYSLSEIIWLHLKAIRYLTIYFF